MEARSFSIHAHFYQPPREDPITGIIPREAGASPFENWNERIYAECYRPNAELGNFAGISFNVGPTLCTWMERHHPETCRLIQEQDRRNVLRFGVGNAIAQAYNHTILPLATYQDKVTQVAWGIADFESRFGRKPEGIWLPETAADMETLEVLANQGISWTILAPWQADQEHVDCSEPYLVNLPDGKRITIFFYQRELSARISFDPGVTTNADQFLANVLPPFFNPEKEKRGEPQLILLASDGELYGHHQALRNHFLARLVDGASSAAGLLPTYPSFWIREHPPRQFIQIRERTSWSCHHGVLRWSGSCGCTPGNGAWKGYMRGSLDTLARELEGLYLEVVQPLVPDPWELRNRYIQVILGNVSVDRLLEGLAGHALTSDQIQRAHLILEAQREQQRMFTSCGWFFEDFDRIEPRNNVAYAAQAVRLAKLATGVDLEGLLKDRLKLVKSNHSKNRADLVFERHLRKAEVVTSSQVGFAD